MGLPPQEPESCASANSAMTADVGTCPPSSVLLSQDPSVQVPSALESLTSVFGMGTGVSFPPLPLDVVFLKN
jgi:hypothetical protein